MKTNISSMIPILTIVPPHIGSAASNGTVSYLVGGIIALLILGYLIYSLLHPDKF